MEDSRIVELFWERNENAINECNTKYNSWLKTISYNILTSYEDSEECVNDTYVKAWNSIPPKKPDSLKSYLGRIIRNLSINRWEERHAQKRDGNNILLSELEECVPSEVSVEREMELRELTGIIAGWLLSLEKEERIIFVRRYWYGDSVKVIAKDISTTPNKLAGRIYRLRQKLRAELERNDIIV